MRNVTQLYPPNKNVNIPGNRQFQRINQRATRNQRIYKTNIHNGPPRLYQTPTGHHRIFPTSNPGTPRRPAKITKTTNKNFLTRNATYSNCGTILSNCSVWGINFLTGLLIISIQESAVGKESSKYFFYTSLNEHQQPNIREATILLYRAIFQWVNQKYKSITRQARRNKHTAFFMITTFLLMILPNTQASSLTSLNKNFIYSHQGKGLLNPQIAFSINSYVPCDLLTLTRILPRIEKAHQNLCARKVLTPLHGKTVIDATDRFILLDTATHNLEEGRALCRSINSTPVEARNSEDRDKLTKFMVKNSVTNTFAGVKISQDLNEPIFISDGSLAAKKGFSTVKNLNGYYQANESITWGTIVDNNRVHEDEFFLPYFVYYVNKGIELTAHYERSSKATLHQQVGFAHKARVICKTPKNAAFHEQESLWKSRCLNQHLLIRSIIQNSISHIEQILPSNLGQKETVDHQFLQLNYYNPSNRNKRSNQKLITDTQKAYSQIISDNTPLQVLCQLKETKNHTKNPLTLNTFRVTEFIDQGFPRRDTTPDEEFSNLIDLWIAKLAIFNNKNLTPKSLAKTEDTGTEMLNLIINIQTYINKAYDYISPLLSNENFVNPQKFISLRRYTTLKTLMSQHYGAQIPAKMTHINAAFKYTASSFYAILSLPINPQKSFTDIYQIIPLPTFSDTKKFLPALPAQFAAFSITGPKKYTILSAIEANKCLNNPFCQASKPTYSSEVPSCGINAFYDRDPSCSVLQLDDMEPALTTVQGRTFYSIPPNNTLVLNIICDQVEIRGANKSQQLRLTDIGYFKLSTSCIATNNKIALSPAYRQLWAPIADHPTLSELSKRDANNLTKYVTFGKKIIQTFNPTTIKRKLRNLVIIIASIGSLAFLLPILIYLGFFTCCRDIIFTRFLTFANTRNNTNDVEQQEPFVQRRRPPGRIVQQNQRQYIPMVQPTPPNMPNLQTFQTTQRTHTTQQ